MVGRPIVDNVLDGFNSTVFCYGQTGSGKTFTMMGKIPQAEEEQFPAEAGLVPRIFNHLFGRIQELEAQQVALQPWAALDLAQPLLKGCPLTRTLKLQRSHRPTIVTCLCAWLLQRFGREVRFMARVSMLELYKEVRPRHSAHPEIAAALLKEILAGLCWHCQGRAAAGSVMLKAAAGCLWDFQCASNKLKGATGCR